MRLDREFDALAYVEEFCDTRKSHQADQAQSPHEAERPEHPKKSELASRICNKKEEIERYNANIERKPRFHIIPYDRDALVCYLPARFNYSGVEIHRNVAGLCCI